MSRCETILFREQRKILETTVAQARVAAEAGARYANIAEAGHMVAGDVNDRFGDAVLDFLRASVPRS